MIMKRYGVKPHGLKRFGIQHPHQLNRVSGYRGGERL